MLSLYFIVALIFGIIGIVSHYYQLPITYYDVDVKYILLLNTICFIIIETLRYLYSFCSSILSSKNSMINHCIKGSFGQNVYSLNSYSSKEIAIFLPVIIETILSIPFNSSWYKHELLLKLLQRIQKERYKSLFQSFSFYISCNQSVLSKLQNISRSNKKLSKLLTKLIKNAEENKIAINYFYEEIYQIALKTIKTKNKSTKIVAPSYIYDPVTINSNAVLSHVEIKKIMASNAKPVLIECWSKKTKKTPSSLLLIKYGDDLRKDAAVLLMFRFINEIWKINNIKYNGIDICSFIYDVIPITNKFGGIEFISNCIKIADIDSTEEIIKLMNVNMNKLIATGIGSFLCSYIIGVRDRHHDNILIKKDDAILFHIDFAYILGETINGLDASKIAIPSNFVKVLGNDNWNIFIDQVIKAFIILRNHYLELIEYAIIIFKYHYNENQIKSYLSKSLCLNNTEKEAIQYIKNKFLKSPSKIKTKMKNAIHDIAVKRIST